ncbi:MAG: TetR/AcrR family transcriptional regulator [Acidimicrobiia bacterium]
MAIAESTLSDVTNPRQQLLERTIDYVSERGMSDLSLRELAAAAGTSHRMLIYHFGSKQALLVEVVRSMEHRQRLVLSQLVESADSVGDVARRFWRQLSDPLLAPHERLFFEVYSLALQGRPYALSLLDDIVDSWIDAVAGALIDNGVAEDVARTEARLGVAVIRGLLLDLLATGDTDGVNDAFERYVASRNLT